jgi:hypothetical protein
VTLSPVPWAVDGGLVGGDVLRTVSYAALGDANGVVGAGDLKVSALAVPGTDIRVAPGAAVLLNRYTGGGQQNYVGRNAADHVFAYPANNTGATRYDLVGLRVNDPGFPGGGSAPPDPTIGPYIVPFVVTGVPAGTKTFTELGGIYTTLPAVPLARMAIPATTSTITNAMIHADLRKLARPRRQRELLVAQHSGGDHDLTSASYVTWPNTATFANIEIPSWATTAKIVARVIGAELRVANVIGNIRALIGTTATQAFTYDENYIGLARVSEEAVDTLAIPSGDRGTLLTVKIEAKRNSGTGLLQADNATASIIDIDFTETAV